jgi:hypothetical protein
MFVAAVLHELKGAMEFVPLTLTNTTDAETSPERRLANRAITRVVQDFNFPYESGILFMPSLKFNRNHLPTVQASTHPYLKTMNTSISFNTDGTAHCLWTEAVPLHELGQLEIKRASTIEFNNNNQQWEVRNTKGSVRFISKSRTVCLILQQSMKPASANIGGP